MTDRRVARRVTPDPGDPLSRVRLRAGRELAVVNISANGVLVEGDARLLPGTHLDVHVMTAAGRLLMRSRVVRAYVSALGPDRVTYRGAFIFDRPITLWPAGYPLPVAPRRTTAGEGIAYPERAA